MSAPALRFEPHNGFGKKDPDGNPWPFGYISDAQPIFELNVILKRDRKALTALAKQMAAAPKILETLKALRQQLLADRSREEGGGLVEASRRGAMAMVMEAITAAEAQS